MSDEQRGMWHYLMLTQLKKKFAHALYDQFLSNFNKSLQQTLIWYIFID